MSDRLSASETMLQEFDRTATIKGQRQLLALTKDLSLVNVISLSTFNGSHNVNIHKAFFSHHNPQNLPHLPVPKLMNTLFKYLKSVRPLLSDDEYCMTKKLVEEFQCSDVAKVLQNYLDERAVTKLNWLEEYRLNAAYLGFRSSVVVYSSPGQSLPFQKFRTEDDRLCYTAKLISAAASYRMLIIEGKLPVEKKGKNELDMSQYNKIFGTVRIPCTPLDGLEHYPHSEHIVVVRRNHFFKLQLFVNCRPLSEKQILEQLQCILSQTANKGVPVGILSSDHRDIWSRTYSDLVALNPISVAQVQQSLFLVCLDDAMPSCNYENLQTEGILQFIHGGGSQVNSANRWYDKTIQFVIGCSGAVGLTFEHSPNDGQPVAVMVDYLVNYMKKNLSAEVPDNCDAVLPEKLCFEVNSTINTHIQQSEKNIDNLVENFALVCFKFDKYGKEFIKSQKLSPDSYIQMAMQLALYTMYGIPAAHYESASTRMYVGGRTEAIRSCSMESVKFAQTMLDSCATDKDKIVALKAAVDGHKEYANEANKGYGVDRHLLGIKLAAKDLCCETPAIFNDVAYTRSTTFRLFTSQVATNCDALMSYGPKSDNGYSLCYNPRKDDINFGLSAWVNCTETNIKEFEKCLVQSLCHMQKILSRN